MKISHLLLALLAVGMVAPGSSRAVAIGAPTTVEYRISGDNALRPTKIWDDGQHTFILWAPDVELPAVFSKGPDGAEILAEGAMHGDQYVLDRIHSVLIFRIDRSVATAIRRAKRHE